MIDKKEQKILKDFGRNLKRLRTEKGFSYRQFALEADLSPSFIEKLEAGISNPSLTTLLKLAEALQVSLDDFTTSK